MYEPTQGTCIQSDTQSDGDIHIHTYLHHKYKKLAITTQSDILLLEVRNTIPLYFCILRNIIPYVFNLSCLFSNTLPFLNKNVVCLFMDTIIYKKTCTLQLLLKQP